MVDDNDKKSTKNSTRDLSIKIGSHRENNQLDDLPPPPSFAPPSSLPDDSTKQPETSKAPPVPKRPKKFTRRPVNLKPLPPTPGQKQKTENLAQDAFSTDISLGQGQLSRASTQQKQSGQDLASADIDPITKAIREQILIRQMSVMKTALIEGDPAKKTQLDGMDFRQFNAYLLDEKNKETIENSLKKPEILKELNSISAKGYGHVHSNFADRYQDLVWEGGANKDSRTKAISDPDGKLITNLTETIHNKQPVTIELSDGSKQTVSSYRTVDFPQKLENGGPLHLSMALKDSTGKNISADNALYFSAHYDKQGNLTEISSPQPIKFAGKGDDAIGYIEQDGKVYTLAVTQGQYKELSKQVELNYNKTLDLSQQQQQAEPSPPPPPPLPREKHQEKDREINLTNVAITQPKEKEQNKATKFETIKEELEQAKKKLKPASERKLKEVPEKELTKKEQFENELKQRAAEFEAKRDNKQQTEIGAQKDAQQSKREPTAKTSEGSKRKPKSTTALSPTLLEEIQKIRANLKKVNALPSESSQLQNGPHKIQQTRDNPRNVDKKHQGFGRG